MRTFTKRIAAAFRAFVTAAATNPENSFDHAAAVGCVLIKARLYGKWRQCRLGGIHGYHVLATADDGGPPSTMLIVESNVAPEDVLKFRAYYQSQLKAARSPLANG